MTRRPPRRAGCQPGRGSRGRWPCRPPRAERRGIEIQIGERDALEVGEPQRLELAGERRRVADQHDRQLVGLEELPGDALDVHRRHALHSVAVGLDLGQIQAEEQVRQHLLRRSRSAISMVSGNCRRGSPARPATRRGFTVSRCSRENSSTIRRRASPVAGVRVSVSATISPVVLIRVEIGGGAVGQRALRSQYAEQPVGALRRQECGWPGRAARSPDAFAESQRVPRGFRSAPIPDDRRRPGVAWAAGDRWASASGRRAAPSCRTLSARRQRLPRS